MLFIDIVTNRFDMTDDWLAAAFHVQVRAHIQLSAASSTTSNDVWPSTSNKNTCGPLCALQNQRNMLKTWNFNRFRIRSCSHSICLFIYSFFSSSFVCSFNYKRAGKKDELFVFVFVWEINGFRFSVFPFSPWPHFNWCHLLDTAL